ncbi:MAG TPA: hypothetical protein VIL46_09590, partial [Gemmataceae bacterium]
TILETHGVRFFEERYRSLGPLGSLGHGRDYPSAIVPGPNAPQYPDTGEPAEEFFDLQDPLREKGALEVPDLPPLPAPAPLPQPRPLPEPPPGKK